MNERMSHDCPPVGTVVPVHSNARAVITSATSITAENLDDEGNVVSSQDATITSEQMLKIRDVWAINEASMAVKMGDM